MVNIESHARSLVKTATYRGLIIVTAMLVSWYYTGDPIQALTISLVFNGIATVIYYVHERAWDRVSWGTKARTRLEQAKSHKQG